MSFKSAPSYWLQCDVCGKQQGKDFDEEFSSWVSVEDAEDEARDSCWSVRAGKHACPECHLCEDCQDNDGECGLCDRPCHCKSEGAST